MKVTCVLDDNRNTKVCDVKWDQMPPTHVSFVYEKKEYMITKIEDSKVTVKYIPPRRKKID